MSSRRNFIQQLTAATGAFTFLPFTNKVFAGEAENRYAQFHAMNDADAVMDEDFWGWVKEQYTVSPNLLNLNNGGVSPQPKVVQDAHIRFYQFANEGPSYYMWRILDDGREALRSKLAELAGCNAEELAINRNATEGLNTIIFGLNLKAGDEVVLTKQDYPNMINAWKQREKRDGIKLIWLNLELPIENEDVIRKGGVGEKQTYIHVGDEMVLVDNLQDWFDATFFMQKENWQKIYPLANIPYALKEFGLEKGFTTFTDETHFRNAFNLKLKNIQDKNGTKNRINGTKQSLTPPEPKPSGTGFGSL